MINNTNLSLFKPFLKLLVLIQIIDIVIPYILTIFINDYDFDDQHEYDTIQQRNNKIRLLISQTFINTFLQSIAFNLILSLYIEFFTKI